MNYLLVIIGVLFIILAPLVLAMLQKIGIKGTSNTTEIETPQWSISGPALVVVMIVGLAVIVLGVLL